MIKVVRESDGPAWTKTAPTAPGYYWLRPQGEEPFVVEVAYSEMRDGEFIVFRFRREWDFYLSEMPQHLRFRDCEWAGPIPVPQTVEGTAADMPKHDVVTNVYATATEQFTLVGSPRTGHYDITDYKLLHNKPCCLDCNYVMRAWPLKDTVIENYLCPKCRKKATIDTPRYNQLTSEQRSKMLELT